MIYCYQNKKGVVPILTWLNEIAHQDKSSFHKMQATLEKMAQHDLLLERPLIKKTPKARTGFANLYKMRLGKYRLFFQVSGENYYLLHAFYKKTQATPEREFKQVKKEMQEATFVPYPKNKFQ